MDALFNDFVEAQGNQIGYLLASTISPAPSKLDPLRQEAFLQFRDERDVQNGLRNRLRYSPGLQLTKLESSVWEEVFTAYYLFIRTARVTQTPGDNPVDGRVRWSAVYAAWVSLVNCLLKGYQNGALAAWTIPCLYMAAQYLHDFAKKADRASAAARDSGIIVDSMPIEEDSFDSYAKNEKLEDAARQINRIFSICNNDRNPIEDSRKWALYYIACVLFKTYFQVGSIHLSKNILRTINASSDMPDLSFFPKAHQVTFNFYVGVIRFLDEDYKQAEESLDKAYMMCYRSNANNVQLILKYLIPTKMITKHQLATPTLLTNYPYLSKLYTPLFAAVKKGDIAGLDAALAAGEPAFVSRRVYLTLERARDIVVRNLFRKVYLAGGYEEKKEGESEALRRTRIPIAEFSAALLMAGAEVHDGEGGADSDEVECIIANLIYKNLMKGYIARDRGMVVLSKAGAFPGTGV